MGDRPDFRDASTINALPSNLDVDVLILRRYAALFSALSENNTTNGRVWVAIADWNAGMPRYHAIEGPVAQSGDPAIANLHVVLPDGATTQKSTLWRAIPIRTCTCPLRKKEAN